MSIHCALKNRTSLILVDTRCHCKRVCSFVFCNLRGLARVDRDSGKISTENRHCRAGLKQRAMYFVRLWVEARNGTQKELTHLGQCVTQGNVCANHPLISSKVSTKRGPGRLKEVFPSSTKNRPLAIAGN